jgi:Carboxypeptidase regulatory-like domain
MWDRSLAAGLVIALFALAMPGVAMATDVALWTYGAHKWSSDDVPLHLARAGATARRLYLSVEDGARLLVDDPEHARRLSEILDMAQARQLFVEAMLLQDPRWAFDPDGAARRVQRVLDFDRVRRAAGRPGFAGLHFDVEPHAEEAWACGGARERRAMVRALQTMFARVASTVRGDAGGPLTMSAALPWWLGPLSTELPEAAPSSWLAHLDEIVLMVYGDPGGPLVGGSVAAVWGRVEDQRLWANLPPGSGVRVGLATYEYRDQAALVATISELSVGLAGRAGFRGFAVFADGQDFGATPVAIVEGRVLDTEGRPVAGARIRATGKEVRSNQCGLFALRDLPPPAVELMVEADGFAPVRVPATGLVPGRQRTLAPVVLVPRR